MQKTVNQAHWLLKLATTLTVIGITLIFVMIVAFALPVLTSVDNTISSGLFNWDWRPSQGQFGILPMIVGSVLLAISSVSCASLFAFSLSCWLLTTNSPNTPFVTRLLHRAISILVRFMTAVPTVVYGFVAIFLLVPLVRETFGGSGFNWLSASLILSLLLLPTMVLVMQTGLQNRLNGLLLTTTALGFTRLQTLVYFVLPQGKLCLLSALVLGFGRAMGDTLIALMLSGNWPQVPLALNDGLRTLTAHMALVTANEVGGMAYDSLFAAGALLLLINGIVSLILRRLLAEAAS